MKHIWKKGCKNFLGAFFWVPIPFKRYQNTSGCGTDRWTEHLIRAIVKSVMENVENERIRNKWGSIPYNVLGMQPNTCEFLIWCA